MIYQNSRYYTQLIDYVSFTQDGNSNPIVFYEFDVIGKISWWEHTYNQNERLEQLAYQYYKRPDYWWIIPEYNPEIVDFTNIAPGTIIRIPRV
jgi:hypothetical protein